MNWTQHSTKNYTPPPMVNRLEGAKTLITGINSGVGCAIGVELASRGAVIVGTYHPSNAQTSAGMSEARARVTSLTRTFALDQTNAEEINRVVAATKEFLDGLDILVTVASRQSPEAFLDMSPKEIQAQINVNLTGTILLIREAANTMIALAKDEGQNPRHRSIGVMGSIRGRTPVKPDAYEAAKGGLHHFVNGISSILGEHGISINAIAPGTIDSPIEHQRYGGDIETYRTAWGSVTPGKLATPQSVAEAMAFALNADSSMTGEIICVDGGYGRKPKLPLPPTA